MTDRTEQALWQALRDVVEPDLGENIVDLGLVQRVRAGSQGEAQIDITLTTQYSTYRDEVAAEVRRAAGRIGVSNVAVRLVTEPVWTPYRMAEPLRALLGLPDNEPEPPVTSRAATWRERLRGRLARS